MGLFNYLFFGSSERPHVHDWETVEWESRYSIRCRIDRENGGLGIVYPEYAPFDSKGAYIPEPSRRVCMTCGRCEDQITEYEAVVRRQIREVKDRKAKAIEIWSACVPDKNNG